MREQLSVGEKDANEGMSKQARRVGREGGGREGCKRRDEHISICSPL